MRAAESIVMKIRSKHITAYIEQLNRLGYFITLHGDFINNSVFLKYNFHQNQYCHYIKTVYGLWNTCICRQNKVTEACKDGAFFGCCHAGVGEFVYPVTKDDKIVCFISVSGYKGTDTEAKSMHFAKKHGLNEEEIRKLTHTYLSGKIPSREEIDAVIDPLVFMLEAYFEGHRDTDGQLRLYQRMLQYIMENYHRHITMQDIAHHLNYSVSSLSHLFFKHSGKSLPEYIDDLRLSEAKWYLAHTDTNITEIAYFLGYSSSNYFSAAFKRKNDGLTPREYRKRENKV